MTCKCTFEDHLKNRGLVAGVETTIDDINNPKFGPDFDEFDVCKTCSCPKHIIPKKDLVDQAVYAGTCRNANQAIWSASDNCFIYNRDKFGSTYAETINHPEDDDGYDLFLPTKKL
jgi:hypothetical protein